MRTIVFGVMLFSACISEERMCCRGVPQKASRRSSASSVEEIVVRQNSFEDNAGATVSLNSGFVRGSGIFINREGDILTSLHLVPEGADPMRVAWRVSGRTRSFAAESLYWHGQLDLLVLRSGAQPEHYARFADGRALGKRCPAYAIGRRPGNGVVKFHGIYLGDGFPYAGAGSKVSNYLLSLAMFSSGGGIFASEDNSLIGISRLNINESQTPVPVYGAAVGDIKLFLRCHRINFEEVE